MIKIATKNRISLSVVSLLQLSLLQSPAQATLLQGHIEQATTGSTAAIAAKVEQNSIALESFPLSYQGTWHCVTTVTDSTVFDVAPGTVTECDVEFKRDRTGRVVARWLEAGWTEGQTDVVAFSTAEARLDRTAYFTSDPTKSDWAARSRESFKLADGQMTSSSAVDQYIHNQYIGRYRTTSVLQKENASVASALPAQQ